MTKNIEGRLEEVERKLAVMEERRRNLIPPALENNPNVQVVLQDGLKALTARLKEQAEAKQFDKAATRFTNAKAECLRELEETARAGSARRRRSPQPSNTMSAPASHRQVTRSARRPKST